MSIRGTCLTCGDAFTLPPELVGRKVRCEVCGTGMVVNVRASDDESPEVEVLPAPPEESTVGNTIPVTPLRRDLGEFRPWKRRPVQPEREPLSWRARLLWAVVVAGVLALLLLAAGRFWWGRRPGRPVQVVEPTPKPLRNPNELPVIDVPPEPKRPEQVVWTATADPLPEIVVMPPTINSAIRIPAGQEVLYPSTRSPLALFCPATNGEGTLQVWDLRTMKSVASYGGKDAQAVALSPDGKFVAARLDAGSVAVWSVADGKKVGTFPCRVQPGNLVDFDRAGNLIVRSSSPGAIQLWDSTADKIVTEFPLPGGSRCVAALSPGRKYLAALSSEPDRLTMYDLSEGKKVGLVELPRFDDPHSQRCEALAFADDGTELAALFHAISGSRLIVWTVADGRVSQQKFPADLKQFALAGLAYKGRPLEWLPDGNGWLIYGNLLVDRSGYLLWQLPPADRGAGPNRLLDSKHMAVVAGAAGGRELRIVDVPTHQIAEVRKSAAADLEAMASWRRESRPADRSTVHSVQRPASVPWQIKADPAGAPPQPFPRQPIRLEAAGNPVGVLFSSPENGQAAVLSVIDANPLTIVKRLRVEPIDLKIPRNKGTRQLFTAFVEDVRTLRADLDPNGQTIVVRAPDDPRRLDIWSIDGNHILGWAPYDNESPAANAVAWYAFLDRERILTASVAGKVVLWESPQCRAVYSIGPYPSGWTLSPGHKYLAASNGTGIDLLEAANGELRGRLTFPANLKPEDCLAIAFRPDDEALAAVVRTPQNQVELARWELKSGASLGHFPLTETSPDLQWCRDMRFVLHDRTLIDLERRRPVWTYLLPGLGINAYTSPDGRHWFAASRGRNQPASLMAQTLPDDAARKAAQSGSAAGVSVLAGDR